MRVPSVDSKRDKLIRHFEKKLAYFQTIARCRREDEAAGKAKRPARQCFLFFGTVAANKAIDTVQKVRPPKHKGQHETANRIPRPRFADRLIQ